MTDKLQGRFTLVDLLFFLCVGVLIYIAAGFLSVFVKRHTEFMTPIIFGLMYGNYISIRYLLLMGK